jgi:hypothetical protein
METKQFLEASTFCYGFSLFRFTRSHVWCRRTPLSFTSASLLSSFSRLSLSLFPLPTISSFPFPQTHVRLTFQFNTPRWRILLFPQPATKSLSHSQHTFGLFYHFGEKRIFSFFAFLPLIQTYSTWVLPRKQRGGSIVNSVYSEQNVPKTGVHYKTGVLYRGGVCRARKKVGQSSISR